MARLDFFLLAGLTAAFACGNFSSLAAAEKPLVFVPVPPYEFIVEKIAGDLVEVRSICGPSDDPHSYSPTAKQLVEITEADLLLSGQLGFESNFFVKVGDGDGAPRQASLLEGLTLLEGHCDHPSHHEDATAEEKEAHVHDEALVDPHVWLSPTNLRAQAESIGDVIKKMLPEEKWSAIDRNVSDFQAETTAVDLELRETLGSFKGTRFYVYHGAFAYFAADYGLEQIAVEIGSRGPTPKQLVKLTEQATEDGTKLIFIQPQFDQNGARALADAIGGTVATIDPLKQDIFDNLRSIAAAIVDSN